MANEVQAPKGRYLRHPVTGEIFPYSSAIAINTYLIPTDEPPAGEAEPVRATEPTAEPEPVAAPAPAIKKGPFGRPIKTEG